jgi:ubiquinone/menaquinone biosynthesis C-methylase UbiE
MTSPKAYVSQREASVYNTARGLPPDTMAMWLETLRNHIDFSNVNHILDLGCGTGRFTSLLAALGRGFVTGVEPSQAMLDMALSSPLDKIEWKQGEAENIPLPDQSVDLVFMSQVFHHLPDHQKALKQIHRVLTPNGQFAIRNGTKENNDEMPWFSCFPEALEYENKRQFTRDQIIDIVDGELFSLNTTTTVVQMFTRNYNEYFEKISSRGLSALIAICDAAFEQGVVRLREWTNKQPKNVAVYEPVDLFVFRKI